MADEYYGFDDEEQEGQGRDHLFLWTVFILLLIGFAFACWLGSFYIFGHPEEPQPYRILKKLNKIDPPRRFEVTAAPPGEFLSAQKLFDRYSRLNRIQLREENAELLRDYIKNYKETKRLVPYVAGRFEIIDTYELQPSSLFPSGVVALAVANDFPQVLLEHVFTASAQNIAGLRANLPRGLDMRLEKTRDLAAVIHVEHTSDGRLEFTAIPLLYGSWGVKGSVGVFSLEPPPSLNPEGGVPIVRGTVLADAMRSYENSRRAKPMVAEDSKPAAPAEPELVRLDSLPPGAPVPATGALPDVPVATPIPALTAKTGPSRSAKPATPPSLLARNSTPALAPTPAPKPRATPAQLVLNATPPPRPLAPASTPRPMPPPAPSITIATPIPIERRSAVPLKPFVESQPSGGLSLRNSQPWRLYEPGKQPPGRTVTPSEATALAERGDIGERLYLRGNFVVTAAGENRAVLRPQGGGDPIKSGTAGTRIIVEFPPSIPAPAEGSTFTRDNSRAFEVHDVRRGADGQVNIYVRDVTPTL
jgi:hypothetical protein